jgi:nitrate reductase NapAB chaperone NapD
MARLEFDFHARPAHPSKPGIVLALVGISALAWTLSNLQAARTTAANQATQIAALEQAKPHAAAKPAIPADATAEAAQARIASQLAYSWQPAFDALAAARSKKVVLLSLEAVQSKAQLKLVAEARQLADAVAYIDVLQQQPGVKGAALIQHELRTDDEQQPVRFSILVELRA